ncbi:MAG TPA: hypothetical protein VJY54_09215 [Lachnospiraceae bacterium]|nr:hypothetical protein [Lachnospiraceae bacterium]
MNSNEEYLDSLLKSMDDSDKKPEEEDSDAIMKPEEIEDMFTAAEKAAGGDSMPLKAMRDHTVESTKNMSTDEIVKLLEESDQNNDQNEENRDEMDQAVEDDLDALLRNLDMNEDLSEISELLKKADNNECVVDMSSEDSNHTDERDLYEENSVTEQNINSDEQGIDQKEKKKKKKKRENRRRKEKNQDSQSKEAKKEGEKKQGTLDDLFSMLTTESDTDVETTSENQSIMEELEAEDQEEANKKKKIKKGKMYGKVSSKEDTGEDTDTKKAGKKKVKRPKKNSKPKKDKALKKVKEEPIEKPSKKISKKSIFVVLLFSVSVFVALLFGIYIGSTFIQTNSAVKAFKNQDYITCYEQLYGMKLSERQSNMFHHAEVVLKMQRRIDMYEKYIKEDKELEALDSLMQAIDSYEELYVKAQSCDAAGEVADLYNKVLIILKEQYDVTEEDARAIADCKSNVDYTRYLTALVGGETVSSDVNADGIVLPKQEIEDVLPAEEELVEPDFTD